MNLSCYLEDVDTNLSRYNEVTKELKQEVKSKLLPTLSNRLLILALAFPRCRLIARRPISHVESPALLLHRHYVEQFFCVICFYVFPWTFLKPPSFAFETLSALVFQNVCFGIHHLEINTNCIIVKDIRSSINNILCVIIDLVP